MTLTNGGFEGGWTRKTHTGVAYGEIFVPEGWTAFWREEGVVPHDPDNTNGYGRPEMHVINREAPFLDPPRIRSGDRAVKLFTFYRIHDAGLYQRVTTVEVDGVARAIAAGMRLRFGAWAHAWTSTQDDPRVSEHSGDAAEQATFRVGIDPGGGTDPWAESVVWGPGVSLYDVYGQIPAVEAVAEGGAVTVFVRSTMRYPFKHCDAYLDDVSLVVVEGEPEPPEGYSAYAMVVDYGYITDLAKRAELYQEACERGIMIGPSHDHIRAWPPGASTYTVEVCGVPASKHAEYAAWYKTLAPHISIVFRNEAPDPQPEPGGGSPSLSPGLHLSTGDSGASDWMRRLASEHPEVPPPSIKAYGNGATMATLKLFKDIDSRVLTVGRLSKGCDPNVNVEGPDLSGDLQVEAQRVMASSMCAWAPHRAYVDVWEVINEQDPVGIEGHRRLAEFFKHCMDIADREGYTIALFSYSLGVPEPEEVATIVATGVLEQALQRGHYLALHEYHHPLDADVGHYALRYREWARAAGGADKMPGVLLTEVNVDSDMRTLDPAEWERQIRWYMGEARKDAYVKAVHLFDWEEGQSWPQFNIKPRMAERWYRMVVELGQPATQPEPSTPEPDAYPPVWTRDIIDTLPLRTDMAAFPGGWAQRALKQITHLTFHHTYGASTIVAMRNMAETYVKSKEGGRPRQPYTLWITREGEVLLASPLTDAGYHDHSGYPNYHLSVGIMGMLNETPPTSAQLDAMVRVANWAVNHPEMSITPERVTGHMDWIKTACPGWLSAASGNWRTEFLRRWKSEGGAGGTSTPLLGFNDPENVGAGRWLQNKGLAGLLVVPVFLTGAGQKLDFSAYAAAGIRVIVNLRYSWSTDCGGMGTFPVPGSIRETAFIDAAVWTIRESVGVWGWEIGNEANNPREFPTGAALTAASVARVYNAIWDSVRVTDLLSPGALDPFNAAAGDPRDWLRGIYTLAHGADFVAAHGYTRGPDPALVGDPERFGDDPLRWQYRNYPGCVTALLEALPDSYRGLGVYVTEFCHLWKTSEATGDAGWVSDARAADVVQAAHAAAEMAGFAGLALYRWSGDAWAVSGNGAVLGAVGEIL